MEIFEGLSDDQTALAGCALALVFSATLMSLSYYIGRVFQNRERSAVRKGVAEAELATPQSGAESRKKAA